MHPAPKKLLPAIVLWTCPVILLLSSCMLFWGSPTIVDCVYDIDGGPRSPCSLPLRMTTGENAELTVRFTLRTNVFSPSFFLVVPDDCLQRLNVNGTSVNDPSIPFCDYSKGKILNLGPQLHAGKNPIKAVIHNNGGSAVFLIQPSWTDAAIVFPMILASIACACCVALLLSYRKKNSRPAALVLLFILATFVRIFYLAVTPHWIRGHDTDGHIEYIHYLLTHWTLPAPDAGWELWQPPLYYMLSALWTIPFRLSGFSESMELFWLQILSLLLSLWTLLLIVQIGKRIFATERQQETPLSLFFALIAFVPGLTMLSARINNDALEVPLAFLAVLLLLEWWKSGKRTVWLWCIVVISLAILSKSNALLLLPVAFICLVIKNKWEWKRTLIDGCAGLLIVAVLAGWFTVYRHLLSTGQDPLVGNTSTLNSGLVVANGPSAYVTFNPVAMVHNPYNSPWEDAARRQYFWEYLYRSAFFGEFSFGEDRKTLASWILLFSFPVFLLTAWTWLSGWKRWKELLPLLLLSIILPVGHAVFRFRYPSASSQDFRYILPLLLPIAAFATLFWTRLQEGIGKRSLLICLQTFIVLCAVFLLHS